MHVRVDVREDQAKLGDTLTLTYGNGGSSTALRRSGQRQAETCGINSEARLQLVPHMSSVYINQINVLHLCFSHKVTEAESWKQRLYAYLMFQHFPADRRDEGGKKFGSVKRKISAMGRIVAQQRGGAVTLWGLLLRYLGRLQIHLCCVERRWPVSGELHVWSWRLSRWATPGLLPSRNLSPASFILHWGGNIQGKK